MEGSVKGDLVVVPFPFSDLSEYKKRPALVIAELGRGDRILCQITSKNNDKYDVRITQGDCDDGGLSRICNVRPNKIFTADERIILYRAGHLKKEVVDIVTSRIIEIVSK
jgi:mRNA interferase MazF